MKANWSVVIVHEDVPTREEAVKFSEDGGRPWHVHSY